MNRLSYRLTLATAMSLVAFGGASVFAVGSNVNSRAHAESTTTAVATGKPDTAPGKPTDAGSQGATHLAAAQLNACQKRETAINNIMARIVDRGTKQIGVFDTIATRTEAFYTSKGKTVADYATMVAGVSAAKAKAETDLAAMKTTSTIDCSGTNPKGTVSAFKSSLQQEIADLKLYRTAVKNLIVAVKSVQGTGSSSSKTSISSSPNTAAKQGGQ